MLYKLVPPSRAMAEIQYIDGSSDEKIFATLASKGMKIVPTPAKKVGNGQIQVGYCLDPKFALVRVQSVRLAMLERVLGRVLGRVLSAARRRPSIEEQLERLNSPKSKAKKPVGHRVFGCDIVEEGGEFVVYKNGVEVGRAKDSRAAQLVAHDNW